METLGFFLKACDKPLSWVLLALMIMLWLGQINMVKEQSVIATKQAGMSEDISQINHKLDNHITDTNKNIEKLTDRFYRLYEILIKDKK